MSPSCRHDRGCLLAASLFVAGCAAPPVISSAGPHAGAALADASGAATSTPGPPRPESAPAATSSAISPPRPLPGPSASATGIPVASAVPAAAPSSGGSPYLGQTAAQIRDSLGPPERVRGRVWIFVRETLDCDRRTETELTFRGGRVVDVKETRSRTGKTCR